MSGLKLKGVIEMQMLDARGEPLGPRKRVENIVTEAGRAWLGSKVQPDSPPSETLGYAAFGSSSAPPSSTQTALIAETVRIAIPTFVLTGLTGSLPHWEAIVSLGTTQGNGTLGEVGLFTAPSGGIMFSRLTFVTRLKTTNDVFGITYQMNF